MACAVAAAMVLALPATFVQGPAPKAELQRSPLSTPSLRSSLLSAEIEEGLPAAEEAAQGFRSWAASILSAGAVLGLALGVLAPQSARAITAEQFSQLTYAQVKGSGLANRCPTVESQGSSIPVKSGARIQNMCFEPKSFAVEAETEGGRKEFVTTKLMTRQTYSLAFIDGPLTANPITFKVEDGLD